MPLHLKLRSKAENGSLVDHFSTRENDRSRGHNTLSEEVAAFGHIASIGFPITNHFSPIMSDSRASGPVLPGSLPCILVTASSSSSKAVVSSKDWLNSRKAPAPNCACASGLKVLSRPRSWPTTVAAAFGAARNLQKIIPAKGCCAVYQSVRPDMLVGSRLENKQNGPRSSIYRGAKVIFFDQP